jgi:hypothetical protein
MSHAALARVHEAMFPLNNQLEGLPALLDRFENGDAVYRFVHEHLRYGALVALSIVCVHYPEIDLELLKKLPPTPSGRVDMDIIMLLVEIQLTVLPDRSSPRVIVRGQIRVS